MNHRARLVSLFQRGRASLAVRNAASGFFALGWLSLLSFLTIPIYIRLLGTSEWGLVAACASLQILSNFIDIGFSQIVPRWSAQEARNPARLCRYIALFRRIYIGLGLLLFVVLQASADCLAHKWFQVLQNRSADLEIAIRIVSFQFLFQFVNSLHTGLWNGLQLQVRSNARACVFGTLKHTAALLALTIGPRQAWVYALAFTVVALLELSINAVSVNRQLECRSREAPSDVAITPVLKEVAVLSGGILIGLLASQLDRIILSRTVSVDQFGIYTIVATLALAFLQLQAPITRAYFPIIVHDIESHGRVSWGTMRRLFAGALITATVPSLVASFFSEGILELWLADPKIVSAGAAPLRLLLLAVALNSLYGCIYQVIIAKGQSRRVYQINLASLAGAGVAILAFGLSGGIVLGGIVWISIALMQLILGLVWFVRN